MYLSSENKDYADSYHLIDLNGIPTLIDKVASSITGTTSYIPGVITEETGAILTFTPDGYGTLSELIINATKSGTFDSLRVLIYNGTNLIWQSEPITSWVNSLTVQPNIGVLDGNTYSVKMRIVKTAQGFSINAGTFTATIAGEVYQSGYFTTKQFTMTDGNKLQTWLYYTGTAPAVSYNVGSGSYTSIAPVSVTASVFMDGTACNVAKYEINGELIKNNVIRFKFDISSSTTIIKEMCGVLL